MKRTALLALFLATPALAQVASDHDDHGHDDHGHEEPEHAFHIGALEIMHPWTNAGHGDHANVFMELSNEGNEPIRLLGARTRDGIAGQIVGFAMKDGEMAMEPIPVFPVSPGLEIDLAPDGLAIHFDGLDHAPEEGHTFEIILMTSSGDVEIDVLVEPEDARRHSHAGHDH
jgi:copper(I)-binding protein